jgi:GT2 family glycosyltransferase
MQIEVVDDHSSDDPASVVQAVGRGRVGFYRQPHNVGHARNFNTCLARSRGQLVHLLHGDDLVLPGFYERLGEQFDRWPEVGAAFCGYQAIDEVGSELAVGRPVIPLAGVVPDFFDMIATGQCVHPPGIAVRRAVYEQVRGFDERIAAYGEDWEMWSRIAASFPVSYEPAVARRVPRASRIAVGANPAHGFQHARRPQGDRPERASHGP